MNKKYLITNIILIAILMPINIISIYLINRYEFPFDEISIILLIQLFTFGIYIFQIILMLVISIKSRLQGGILALAIILSWIYGFIQIKYLLSYLGGNWNMVGLSISILIYIGLNIILIKKILNYNQI
jgi:hypothetical protein